jgi:hypothetical protein
MAIDLATFSSAQRFILSLDVSDAEGRIPIHFDADLATRHYPSTEALRLHRTACLIWRLLGAAECMDDYDEDDEDDPSRVWCRPVRIDDLDPEMSSKSTFVKDWLAQVQDAALATAEP